jgi:hypothetical protein
MNLKSILNKNSPWAHSKLEFDMLYVARRLIKYMLGVARQTKLMKYLVQSSKRKNWQKEYFLLTSSPNHNILELVLGRPS